MKKFFFGFALIFFTASNIFMQELLKKAEANPLDCAFHLLKAENRRVDEIKLALAFFEVGRYNDAIETLKFKDYQHLFLLVKFTKELLKKNKASEAQKFLNRISILLSDNKESVDEDALIELAPILIDLGKPDEAVLLVKKAEYEEDQIKTAIAVSRNLLDANYPEMALKVLEDYYGPAKADRKAEIIELYARLKQKEKAEKMLADFEPIAFVDEEFYHNRRFVLFPLINANLALGKLDHSLELWQQHGESDDGYGYIKLIDALSEFGYRDKSYFYLNQIASDKALLEDVGSEITDRFLKLSDISRATSIAKSISDDAENYEQHQALISIADKLIETGKTNEALEILEFSLRRAAKIFFQHEPMQSTSSGTIKRNFLFQIYSRYIKLKKYGKASETIFAINSDHSIARTFVAESLADLAKQQSKTLPRKKIHELLIRAQNTVKDEEYYSIEIKVLSADIYAQIGDKEKAVQLIAKALEDAKESCCYGNDFLISAGKVFEENNLEANINLRRTLQRFISD